MDQRLRKRRSECGAGPVGNLGERAARVRSPQPVLVVRCSPWPRPRNLPIKFFLPKYYKYILLSKARPKP